MMKYTYLNDKYFMNLDDFNKNLIPHKSNFFKDCQGFSFSDLLKSLSFNLDVSSSNYRWGKRYFNNIDNKFSWLTSNNKKISKLYWNSKNHQYENIDVTAYFTNEMIENHFLSCYKKNRKINFFYKLSNQNKSELKNHLTALSNMYMVDGKTFGSTQQLNSDILLIDIDNYEDIHALETLSLFLEELKIDVSDLLFLEQNVFTGGIHTALRLPHKITNSDFYTVLMKELKNKDIKIECNFINNILRFPLSFEYVAIKKSNDIFDYDEYIPDSLWEKSFHDYLNNLNDNVCNSEYLNNIIIQTQQLDGTFDKWENYWKIKKHLFKKVKDIKNFKEYNFYKLQNGCRYESMSKIVPYSKMTGHSLDETVNLIFENNIDSKDLSKWSKDKLKNNIRKFYDNCPDKVCTIIKSSSKFVSNEKFIPEITKKFFNNKEFNNWFTNQVISEYLKERNRHNNGFKSFSNEKKEILIKIMPIFLTEIIGKMFYDINEQKEFINKTYNNLIGFQLSDNHLKMIQDYAIEQKGIKSVLAKTSIQYLKKAILNALKIKEIKYTNRIRNWMLGSCKSFYIKSISDIYNLLNNLYNRCFSMIVTNNFLMNISNNNNELIILYISLIENYDFFVSDDIKYTLYKIPWLNFNQ